MEISEKELAELIKAKQDGRLIILPEDGMLYHVEAVGEDRWIGNKPIQDIVFKCGWGIAALDFHISDFGKTWFFDRKSGEVKLLENLLEVKNNG